MPAVSQAAAAAAVTLPLFQSQAPIDKVSGLVHAATLLARSLEQSPPRTRSGGRALDSRALRAAMETAFAGSDAEGAWVWKDAYEALEAAQVLFLRKYGVAMRARAGSPNAMLEMLARLAERLPSQTRRTRRIRAVPAIFDPDHARLCCRRGGGADPFRPRSRTFGRDGAAGDLRRARQSASGAQRDRRDARRAARPPLPRRSAGDPAQRRADPRPSRTGFPADRHLDEPALLGLAACREALCRGRLPPCRFGPGASRSRRAPRRDHRPQYRPRGAGLARSLRAAARARPCRVHRGRRRAGLCPPRHDDGHKAHRHRQHPGRGSAPLSIIAGHRRQRGRAARLGRPACTAARADRRHHPPALSRRSDSSAAVAHRCAQTCAPQQAGARS